MKNFAIIFGVILLIVGVLGFIPGITVDGHLFGIFQVGILHNLVHLITGGVAVYAGMTSVSASRSFFQIFGVIYAVIAVLGFFYQNDPLLGILSHNMADTWLHVLFAVLLLYAGFFMRAEERVTA